MSPFWYRAPYFMPRKLFVLFTRFGQLHAVHALFRDCVSIAVSCRGQSPHLKDSLCHGSEHRTPCLCIILISSIEYCKHSTSRLSCAPQRRNSVYRCAHQRAIVNQCILARVVKLLTEANFYALLTLKKARVIYRIKTHEITTVR